MLIINMLNFFVRVGMPSAMLITRLCQLQEMRNT